MLTSSPIRRPRGGPSAGFALIDVLFVIGIIGILMAIAMPRLVLAKNSASAASAVGTMRTINSAEVLFAITCGSGFYAPNLTALGMPPPGATQAFIAPGMGSANVVTKSGYTFEVAGTPYAFAPPTCNGLAAGTAAEAFKVRADPTQPTNGRYFATNSSMQIFEDSASLWAAMPEAGPPPSGHVIQ